MVLQTRVDECPFLTNGGDSEKSVEELDEESEQSKEISNEKSNGLACRCKFIKTRLAQQWTKERDEKSTADLILSD